MACQMYPEERFSYVSDFEHCWRFTGDKLDAELLNLKMRMNEDGINSNVRGVCNVLEALPVDPFEMGMSSSSFTAVSGRHWFDGVKGYESTIEEYATDEGELEMLGDQLFVALRNWKDDDEDEDLGSLGDSDSFFVDDGSYADSLPQDVEELLSYALASLCSYNNQAEKSSLAAYPDGKDDGVLNSCSHDDSLPENVEELLKHALESLCFFGSDGENSTQTVIRTYSREEPDDGVHDALFFALGYLGVKDLLSVQGVCKTLNDAVKRDPLLWRHIHIDGELNSNISDDTLLQLTSRAEGALQSLSLIRCTQITDIGLTSILESNPGITMLSVPDCSRLTIDGVVSSLKEFMCAAKPGLRHLRIAGIHGVTDKHIDELKSILSSAKDTKPMIQKPMLYHMVRRGVACIDDRALDIDICPQCQEARMVYDCPGESCRNKSYNDEQCRGCILCIPRCFMCGGCVANRHFMETFCLEYLCFDCVQRPKDRDIKEGSNDLGVKCMIIIQGVHCECCMHG